jgi:S1-C subfamily serine protease
MSVAKHTPAPLLPSVLPSQDLHTASMMLLHAAAPHHAPQALPRKSRPLAATSSSDCRADRRRLRRLNGLSTVLQRTLHSCATATAAAVAVEEELLGVEEENGGVDAKAVVKLHCTSLDPDWVNPWQSRTAQRSTGSGVFIRRKGDVCEILTAAHVVANTTFVQVQLAGQPDKTTARVSAVAHETDLALVEVPASLFEGIEPLDVAPGTTLPALREKVYVLGFPVGGDDLSITEGVVSRIEVRSMAWRLICIDVPLIIIMPSSPPGAIL